MKNKTILLGVFVLLFSVFVQAQNDWMKLSGKITNPTGNQLIIKNGTIKKVIKLNEDGTFLDTIHVVKEGIYPFSDGRERSSIYLKNGYDLNLTIDTKEFDESIKYTGKGAENNNFLAKKALIEEREQRKIYTLYGADEKTFLERQNALIQEYNLLLDKLKDKDFVEYQKKEIKYAFLQSLSNFESYHQYIAKNDTFKVSKKFLNPVKAIDLNNENDYLQFPTFKNLVNNHYLENINDTTKTKDIILSINNIKSSIIKKGVLTSLLETVDISNPHLANLYNVSMEVSDDEGFKNDLKQKYTQIEKLLPGNISPTFVFKDIDDKPISLSDFKGKYVYIDVWATWCSPCRREIPFLKKLEEEFKGKDIAFVSISVDRLKDYDKWKKMVHDKEMKGYQLFADKSWQSDFVQAYRIKGIPTFILIDREGKIISASAKRPSNPTLKKQFEALLK